MVFRDQEIDRPFSRVRNGGRIIGIGKGTSPGLDTNRETVLGQELPDDFAPCASLWPYQPPAQKSDRMKLRACSLVRSAMQRYFFDLEDNQSLQTDADGTECHDLVDMKRQAIKALVEYAGERLPNGDHHVLKIQVRENEKDVVMQVALHLDVEIQRRSDGTMKMH